MDKIYLSLSLFDELAKTKRMVRPSYLKEEDKENFGKLFVSAVNILVQFFDFKKKPSDEQVSKSLTFLSSYLKYYKEEPKPNVVSEMFDEVIVNVTKILNYKFNEGSDVQKK